MPTILDEVPTGELLDEICKRCSAAIIAVIPIMDTSGPNEKQQMTMKVTGDETALAWIMMSTFADLSKVFTSGWDDRTAPPPTEPPTTSP